MEWYRDRPATLNMKQPLGADWSARRSIQVVLNQNRAKSDDLQVFALTPTDVAVWTGTLCIVAKAFVRAQFGEDRGKTRNPSL
jgi:hypothetical protein